MLRGKNPEKKDFRFKAVLSGKPGTGITTAALRFPNNYIIDLGGNLGIYYKTAQKMGSKIAEVHGWRELEDEIYSLSTTQHPYKYLTIDTMSVYWQWLKDMWDDKFIAAQIREDLLQDFGQRYWNKVKKQYRDIRKILKDLDMNVLILAHDIPEYAHQQIIGRKPDLDNRDAHTYYFHFRFYVDSKGKFLVKTVKQNIDLEDPHFPDVFEWSYDKVTEIWGKNVMEADTIYKSGENIKQQSPTVLTEDSNKQKNIDNTDNIKFILSLLKKAKIKQDDFVIFLKEKALWTSVDRLSDLSNKQIKIIKDQWETKILPKFKESASPVDHTKPTTRKPRKSKNEKENLTKETKIVNSTTDSIKNNLPKITENQKEKIMQSLKSYNIDLDSFFSFLSISGWEEITERGADGMMPKLDIMLSHISSTLEKVNKDKEK